MMNERFIPRGKYSERIRESISRYPVTVLLGPRQVGKSTLAHLFPSKSENHFDLENPLDLSRLERDSFGLLSSLEGVVVIDEIQVMPEIFPELRVIVDDPLCRARFVLTGSASPELAHGTAESLAGRVNIIEISGFSLAEVGRGDWENLWIRGGFPRAFLAEDDSFATEWLENYLKTWVMRDIRFLAGGELPPAKLANFLLLLAHYHGQAWNQHKVSEILKLDVKTVQKYLEVFEGTYLIRILYPFEKNVGKRLHKSPRVYIRDSGLLHHLLRIKGLSNLKLHDSLGESWEGFAMEQVIRAIGEKNDFYFWRTHAGAEIDLIFPHLEKPLGFEFKASTNPKVTKGTHHSIEDLGLSKLFVVYRGSVSDHLSETIQTLPIFSLSEVELAVS